VELRSSPDIFLAARPVDESDAQTATVFSGAASRKPRIRRNMPTPALDLPVDELAGRANPPES
jgi:hypothetical protein